VKALIVDASAVGAYLLPDETSDILPGLTEALSEQLLIVPPHWHFEVANLALNSVRRKRLFEAELPGLAESIRALRVEVDALAGSDAWDSVMRLALSHGLTVYDAAYLALAKRRGLSLATLDKRLLAAASTEGVEVFGE
jgi:predicted nucleic acid-binding protein